MATRFVTGEMTASSLLEGVAKARARWPQSSDPMRFEFALKRFERSCQRHFCALWAECRRHGCQYEAGPSWADTGKHWQQLHVEASAGKTRGGGESPRKRLQQQDGRVACETDETVQARQDQQNRLAAFAAVQQYMLQAQRSGKRKRPEEEAVSSSSETAVGSGDGTPSTSSPGPPGAVAQAARTQAARTQQEGREVQLAGGSAKETRGADASAEAARHQQETEGKKTGGGGEEARAEEDGDDFDQVPVVDLQGLDFPDEHAEMEVARRVGHACRKVWRRCRSPPLLLPPPALPNSTLLTPPLRLHVWPACCSVRSVSCTL